MIIIDDNMQEYILYYAVLLAVLKLNLQFNILTMTKFFYSRDFPISSRFPHFHFKASVDQFSEETPPPPLPTPNQKMGHLHKSYSS